MSRTALRTNGHTQPQPAVVRCAVYSRVSTDEQTALEFNSLQAQEQICRTYADMRSADPAARERWVVFEAYSDPGYSGGTLERPALRRLLADVEAGRIDTILIYKIDRLSRSIHQFYRIWEILERHRVGLVSATQDLNTSTSQGKLMLNMLLSFGQFEREQIGERTRDKIQAARRRGKWTGGTVPLGFDLRDGRLAINGAEADTVRQIYDVYLKTPSLTRTVEDLTRRGVTAKKGTRQNGSERPGRPFDKPTVLRLLRNPLYAGLIRSNGGLVAAEHEAMIPPDTWQRVQDLVSRNGSAGYQGERENHEALLRGLLWCGTCGSRMTPTYAVKGSRRYRYYTCQSRLRRGAHACPTGRVAAAEVERLVVERIRAIGQDPALIAETARQVRARREELVVGLQAEQKALRRELRGKRASLMRLVARGASATGLQERIAAIEARLGALPGEIQAAKQVQVDGGEICSALEAFGTVWYSLWPKERARIVDLLVERVDYGGRDQAALRLRAAGGVTPRT